MPGRKEGNIGRRRIRVNTFCLHPPHKRIQRGCDFTGINFCDSKYLLSSVNLMPWASCQPLAETIETYSG